MARMRGKMQAYAEARADGLEPKDAAMHAGYGTAGASVTTSRLEARADIRAEIKRLRKGGKRVDKAPQSDDSDEMEKWGMRDSYDNPLDLLLDVMNNPKAPKGLRYTAAKDAMPYCHARKEGGKKEEESKRSKKVATEGSFRTAKRPSHLRSVN